MIASRREAVDLPLLDESVYEMYTLVGAVYDIATGTVRFLSG
ncbi:MAG: hypothetical protein ACHRXM_21320 [Isosphaerales bacterium]